MNHNELAQELAEFWLPTLVDRDWEGRLEVLNEIHAQLYQDLPTQEEYDSIASRFVAAVIEHLGTPPICDKAQAQIYATSAEQGHWSAAFAWQYARQGDTASSPQDSVGKNERRRWPRQWVDKLTQAWVEDATIRCRLIDLSKGGARIATLGGANPPAPGSAIHICVPEDQIREAVVVFSKHDRAGLQFAGTS
ncbi:PilZ domain-containing protein [Thioalkalivibrio sp. ALJT]|uniref:PilZ domain-containing protein n=1 Tax=Thioalkalivibrio sp. ALJT TaxID=1158146 RepID=UPI000376BB94|nr:PilZ domain-containing protein [Thioalkalivibrio sp. ALJT]